MSEAETTPGTSVTPSDAAISLDHQRIESILGDFRRWLGELRDLPAAIPESAPPRDDLFSLVGHFVALKHEVNLQTRASRTAIEQNAETLKLLAETLERSRQPVVARTDDRIKPLLKAIVDVYDALALAERQVATLSDSLIAALQTLHEKIEIDELPPVSATIPTPITAVGFWSRLFGRKGYEAPSVNPLLEERNALDAWRTLVSERIQNRHDALDEAADIVNDSLEGMLAGYQMSLARIDRLFPQFDLEVIPTQGEMFDAEIMEAMEVVHDSGYPAGTVLEEVRRGYRWSGAIFRYSQVKVAK